MPTIIPVTQEEEWIAVLRGGDLWKPPLLPTLLLAPHPDDETLGAGGLILRLRGHNVPVTIVAVTDGENAYENTSNLGAVRGPEQVEALRRLDVPATMIQRLHLPDREVAAHEDELVDLLMPLLSEGMHIVAPWPGDFHPDHEAVGRAAARLAQIKGLPLTFYLFWTWHRGTPALLENLPLVILPLTDSEVATKLYALEAHASQFEHPDGQPILSEDLLKPAHRTFEVFIR